MTSLDSGDTNRPVFSSTKDHLGGFAMQSILRYSMLCGLLLATTIVPTTAVAQRALPVEKMEIQGFRLGMTVEEVRARLRELGYTETSVYSGISKDEIYNRDLISAIEGKRGKEYVRFKFTSRVPVDQARPTELYLIYYKIPSTEENAKLLSDAVIAKYGPPTVSTQSWWCANPGRAACLKPKQPMMMLGYGNLQLEDSGAFDRVNAYLDAQVTTKPKL